MRRLDGAAAGRRRRPSAGPGCTSRGSRSPACSPTSPQAELARLERAVDELRDVARPDAGHQRPGRRRAARGARGLPHVRPRHAAGCAGSARRSAPASRAEAAVRRVQEETRVRIGHASDPYLRERLIDLDDLANRLLRHLVGKALSHDPAELPRRHHPGGPQPRRRRPARVRPPQAARRRSSRKARRPRM